MTRLWTVLRPGFKTLCFFLLFVVAGSTLQAQFLDQESESQADRGFIGITSLRWVDDDISAFANFQIAIDGGAALDEERHWYFITAINTGELHDSRLVYAGLGTHWFPFSRPDRGLHIGIDVGYAQSAEFFSQQLNGPLGSGLGAQAKLGFSWDPIDGVPPLVVSGVLGIYDVHRTYKTAGIQVGLLF